MEAWNIKTAAAWATIKRHPDGTPKIPFKNHDEWFFPAGS